MIILNATIVRYQMIKLLLKNKLILTSLLIFLIASRFYQIDLFPVGLTHDEVVYALQARSFAKQGLTANQQQSIFSLKPVHPWYAELPAVLMSPFYLLTDNQLLATRLFPAFLSVSFPFIFAWFVFQVWGNKKLALVSLVMGALSPLWWQFGRLAYDPVYSVFFYILGGAMFLSKNWKLVIASSIVLIIGFFQYQGFKLIFPIWIIALILIKNQKYKKFDKNFYQSLVLAIICGVVFLIFSIQSFSKDATRERLSFTLLGDSNYISEKVNLDRRLSFQNTFTKIGSNKPTLLMKDITEKLSRVLSLEMLFVNGEAAASGFAVWRHGFFYTIDFFLIILGVYVSLRKKVDKFKSIVLLLLIPALLLPALLNTSSEWYLFRGFFSYTILTIFVSWGAYYLFYSRQRYLFSALYLLGVLAFVLLFYNRYPVYSADSLWVSERVMSEYINRVLTERNDQEVVIYTVDPPILFSSYLIYSNAYDHHSADSIAAAINEGDETGIYEFGLVSFRSDCVNLSDPTKVVIAEYWRGVCNGNGSEIEQSQIDKNSLAVPNILDSGAKFNIYHDQLCTDQNLKSFTQISNIDDFSIEKMDKTEFCYKWIIKSPEKTE